MDIQFVPQFGHHLVGGMKWGICASGDWGFTPLWAVARDIWMFAHDEQIKAAASRAASESGPTTALGELDPNLIVCRSSKSFDEIGFLARHVAEEAKGLDLQCLVIDSFRDTRGKMKLQVAKDLLPPFIEASKSSRLSRLLVVVNQKSDFGALQEVADRARGRNEPRKRFPRSGSA